MWTNILGFEYNDLFFLWKPCWIPSSFGEENSFLEKVFEQWVTEFELNSQEADIMRLLKYDKIDWFLNIIENQKTQFSSNLEYGLLNRLDNDTWWLLYFAKNQKAYDQFKKVQSEWLVVKIYIADVDWIISDEFISKDGMIISNPIMHHRFQDDRMIVIADNDDIRKWRWKQQQAITTIKILSYDKNNYTTRVQAQITKWVRHQIRVHLAHIGFPIIWEKIYKKWKSNWYLHLRSMWVLFQ